MRINVREPHQCDPLVLADVIKRRASDFALKYPKARIMERHEWTTPTRVDARYEKATGWIELTKNEIVVTIELPLFAFPFKSKIESFLRSEITAAREAARR